MRRLNKADFGRNKDEAGWGKHIRSYVVGRGVTDHRTGHKSNDVDSVLDGDVGGFVDSYLKRRLTRRNVSVSS